MSETCVTRGVHHVGLNVADLAVAKQFFVETLGFREVGGQPAYPAVFVSDGTTMITLWQAPDRGDAVPFDRKRNVGLHHLALRVDGAQALEDLHRRLAATDGVRIEFPPEPLGTGPTRHMMCFMPGGIRIEFIAPAG